MITKITKIAENKRMWLQATFSVYKFYHFLQMLGILLKLEFIYIYKTAMAKGGKGFICMESTFTDKKGNRYSCIKPNFNGDIITDPRSQAHFLVTEFGCVNLAGRSTWERAEMLISIAHPDFREELIKAAEAQKIWRGSNKR